MLYLDYAKQIGNRYILNLFADSVEDINEISPFDTYDINKEEKYFNELIKTEPQMEVWDDNMESQKK